MAFLMRPLKQLPRWQHERYLRCSLYNLICTPSGLPADPTFRIPSPFTSVPDFRRSLHIRSRALKPTKAPIPTEFRESDGDESESDTKKSRNEKKREARRAVKLAMELASFSIDQIKRILSVASPEPEVLEAFVVVKSLGRDVREGKRRQFNYIGKLLRDADPDLMEDLIQATKDGDLSKIHALSVTNTSTEDGDEVAEDTVSEDEVEESPYADTARRWFDGLVNKDVEITKEVYSIQEVDFDRQELRRLFREVQVTLEENEGKVNAAAVTAARSSLMHFLQTLAEQLQTE